MRLPQRDYEALNRATLELHSFRDADAFHHGAPGVLARLVPADHYSLADCIVNVRTRRVTLRQIWGVGLPQDEARDGQVERLLFQHPFTAVLLATGGVEAMRLSDFLPRAKLHASAFYRGMLQPGGIEHVLSVGSFAGSGIAVLTAARGPRRRDFSDRDCALLTLLRPHFDQARRNTAAAARRPSGRVGIGTFGFTPREAQVAEWISRGRSNPEIAIALHMRVRTVEKHVERILAKLGVEHRASAAVILANSLQG